jgi:hypothetical protein
LKWWSPQVLGCLSCKNTMGRAHFQWNWHGYISKCCDYITIEKKEKENKHGNQRKVHSAKWFMEYPKCGHVKNVIAYAQLSTIIVL